MTKLTAPPGKRMGHAGALISGGADTAQAHRVCQPLGMREQLTFHKEPVAGITPTPAKAARPFVRVAEAGVSG